MYTEIMFVEFRQVNWTKNWKNKWLIMITEAFERASQIVNILYSYDLLITYIDCIVMHFIIAIFRVRKMQ
jgi:hypothetical protein